MPDAKRFTRTRIAPTPSGFLHLGNAYSFALTVALARQTGARILLRIDDLDSARVRREYIEDIFETLRFLDIPWNEGPTDFDDYERNHSQLHRMDRYRNALQQLKAGGHVFGCNCTRSQLTQAATNGKYPGTCRNKHLPLDAPDIAWRLNTEHAFASEIVTVSGNRIEKALPNDMQSFIVRKKDGNPAYQLASLVDDDYFGIDLIVRGEDLWPSTLAQMYLSQVLNIASFQKARFFHHPLLMDAGNQKMSKSAGSTSIQYLRRQGKSRADIYNMIAHMAGCGKAIDSWEALAEIISPD